jgi:hypothetical protein
MIRRKLVPVAKSSLNKYVREYVGNDKPEAPMHWKDSAGGRPELMPVGNLKIHFDAHQSEQVGRQWRKEDTAKVLYDHKLEEATRNGVDPSCIKPPDIKTVNVYHSTLMSAPDVGRRAGK